PAELRDPLHQGRHSGLTFRIVRGESTKENAEAPHPLTLLPARCNRPCRRAAGERNEFAAVDAHAHSIISSACAEKLGGRLKPVACAVLRLITSSNLVGSRTGRSVVLAPLRTFPTYVPS